MIEMQAFYYNHIRRRPGKIIHSRQNPSAVLLRKLISREYPRNCIIPTSGGKDAGFGNRGIRFDWLKNPALQI